ncbi:MAG: GntR family transcriptional regulator [Lactobacillaceae bacterium]|nr:GntR family transcriptional regulator [Lactobacillaceae bacterium]
MSVVKMPEEIQPKSLADQAYEILLNKIVFNEYQPGDKVSMRHLGDELQIGRTPISVAMSELEHKTIVEKRLGSGTYIAPIRIDSVKAAHLMRAQVEKKVMELAFPVLDAEAIAELVSIINSMREGYEQNDPHRVMKYDNLFHEKFYEISGYYKLWQWEQDFNIHFNRFRWLSLTLLKGDRDELIQVHLDMLDTIARSDFAKTSELIDQHYAGFDADFEKIMKTHPDYFG